MAYGQSVSLGSTAKSARSAKCAVADLATACAAQERHFAHRERREVVVQHEALLGFALEGLQPLHVFAGAQGRGDQRLGFAAGEDRRSVRARQHADLNPDVADLVELAAIRTPLLFDHLLAEDLLAQHVEVLARLLAAVFVFLGDRRLDFVLELLDERVAFVLGMLLGVGGIGQPLAHLACAARRGRLRRSPPARPCASACRPSSASSLMAAQIFLICSWPNSMASTTTVFGAPRARPTRSSRCLRRCRPPSGSDRPRAARHRWD